MSSIESKTEKDKTPSLLVKILYLYKILYETKNLHHVNDKLRMEITNFLSLSHIIEHFEIALILYFFETRYNEINLNNSFKLNGHFSFEYISNNQKNLENNINKIYFSNGHDRYNNHTGDMFKKTNDFSYKNRDIKHGIDYITKYKELRSKARRMTKVECTLY